MRRLLLFLVAVPCFGQINSAQATNYLNSAGTRHVQLGAPSAFSSNVRFNLPTADGSAGDCLQTDGAGNWSFNSCSSGSGSFMSLTINGTLTIDSNRFAAFGAAAVNDSTADGYVMVNTDKYFLNQDNESRAVQGTNRAYRTTVDAYIGGQGWDQFGVSGVVQLYSGMNLPFDSNPCGSLGTGLRCIRGQQKPVTSELYYDTPVNPYYALIGLNGLFSLARVGTGVTLNQWGGVVVSQPGAAGGGGTVTTGYGLWVQNLDDSTHILTGANAAALKIDGYGNYGRILWTGASISNPSSGILSLTTSSYTSANGSIVANTALTDTAGYYMSNGSGPLGIIQWDNANTRVNVGNVFNVSAAGDFTTGYSHHVDAGAIYTSGASRIDSSGNGSFANLSFSGTGPYTFSSPLSVSGSTVSCPTCSTTTYTGGTGVTVSGSTISIGQAVGTGNSPAFTAISTSTGSIQANTSLVNGAGFYMGATGIIQYDTGSSKTNIGNVFNVTATGDIVTGSSHHIDAGYLYTNGTSRMDSNGLTIGSGVAEGTAQMSSGSVSVSTGLSNAGHCTASVISGGAPTEYVGHGTISSGSVTFYSSNGSSSSYFDWICKGTP